MAFQKIQKLNKKKVDSYFLIYNNAVNNTPKVI